MLPPEGKAVPHHGFGMPPAPKEETKNGATVAEGRTTGAGNASITRTKERTRGGKTAVKEFEDKYFTFPLPSVPPRPARPNQISSRQPEETHQFLGKNQSKRVYFICYSRRL